MRYDQLQLQVGLQKSKTKRTSIKEMASEKTVAFHF